MVESRILRLAKIAAFSAICPCVLSIIAAAQTTPGSNETDSYAVTACRSEIPIDYRKLTPNGTVKGGLLNRRVECGVLPEYASSLRKISETITVNLLVSGEGGVVRAWANKGNKSLRAAALKAARNTYFGPTLLGGQTVNLRGVLIYRFDSKRGVWLPRFTKT